MGITGFSVRTLFFSFSILITSFITLVSSSALVVESNNSYALFESGQVRPLALSPDGKLLFAENKPDNAYKRIGFNLDIG